MYTLLKKSYNKQSNIISKNYNSVAYLSIELDFIIFMVKAKLRFLAPGAGIPEIEQT